MFFNWKKKNKKSQIIKPSEYLKDTIVFIHDIARQQGYANLGFICNDGLMQIAEPIINESIHYIKDNVSLLEMTTSNLQLGVVLGRQCGIDKKSLIDGSFFDEHEDFESLYNELCIALKEDMHKSIDDWNNFREFIIPKALKLIDAYKQSENYKLYLFRLELAYYCLGVSIGLEKYE